MTLNGPNPANDDDDEKTTETETERRERERQKNEIMPINWILKQNDERKIFNLFDGH